MDIEVIRKDKNMLEFKMKGERHSFPNLLRKELSQMKDVEFVSYKLEHPLDTDAIFLIKTKGEDPRKLLAEAAKKISDDAKEFQEEVKKAFK